MPVTIYLKSNPAWPLLAVRRDGSFFLADGTYVPRVMIEDCQYLRAIYLLVMMGTLLIWIFNR